MSGSKSQPGSGVPAAAFLNKSDNFVNAPSVTFLQKSGPSAALKVTGSHSSKATTCATLGGCSFSFSCASACVAPANIKQPASKPNFTTVIFITVLLPFCSGIRSGKRRAAYDVHGRRVLSLERKTVDGLRAVNEFAAT